MLMLALCSGCQAIGALANIAPKHTEAKYAGLAGQSAGVMVWADRAAKLEWPSIQLDLANQVQNHLYANKAAELKGTTWPQQPGSIVRYQLDHPGIEAVPVTEVAPKLGVNRLIYIEIQRFTTRSDEAYQMYRGNVTMTLRVVAVNGNQASMAYEEEGINAFYPPKSTAEGVLNQTDVGIYRGTIAAAADAIVDRLASHDE